VTDGRPSPRDLRRDGGGLRARLDALGSARRAELLHVLMLPDFERAERIGEFWSYPQSRTIAELLIDCEENRVLRAVSVGMLREADCGRLGHTRNPRPRGEWLEGEAALEEPESTVDEHVRYEPGASAPLERGNVLAGDER
jgi:hypothetical protein